jgi:predicted MFS family arabinose efflux permease
LNPDIRHNVIKYFILAILRGVTLGVPVVLWVVFLQQHYGFTLTQVVLLDIPFWVGKFVFEIPTGVVADKFGRKLSLAISAVMSSLIWLIFAFSGTFIVLAIAQFFGAMAATFHSGADEALLFESMQAVGEEEAYARVTARARAAETVSAMLSGLAVGWIASENMVIPVVLTAVFSALMLIPILLMKETGGTNNAPRTAEPRIAYAQIVRQATNALRSTALLRWAAAYLVILGSVSFYAIMFLQPYTIALGLPIIALGPVMVGVQLASIGGSLSLAGVQKRLGSRAILVGVPVLLAPCLLALGLVHAVPVLASAMAASFLFSLTQPVLLAVIQRRISNEARATLLSLQSMLFTVFLILTEPPLGLLADEFGVESTYLVMAGMIVLFCFPLLWVGRRWLDGKQDEAQEL